MPSDFQQVNIRHIRVLAMVEEVSDLDREGLVGQETSPRRTGLIAYLPHLREPDLLLAGPSRDVEQVFPVDPTVPLGDGPVSYTHLTLPTTPYV